MTERTYGENAAAQAPRALAAGLMLLGACTLATSGCGARYLRSTSAAPTQQLPAASISRHVIVVSIDGLRPDAIETYAPRCCSG